MRGAIEAVYRESDNKRKPVSTVVSEIPSRKLQSRRRASSWKICRARRGPANPGGTKSHRNS